MSNNVPIDFYSPMLQPLLFTNSTVSRAVSDVTVASIHIFFPSVISIQVYAPSFVLAGDFLMPSIWPNTCY